ncbi:conserved hypothetical protein [Streptomyces sviceus ATCC 29083]|uniref:Uncharacterized protein n=2 Tax=Streptomyces TaxID=1883 RepID=B5I0H0_STRX2|nr:conserved hypothetical protein [Streptomyces sviceus ATCC 29083]
MPGTEQTLEFVLHLVVAVAAQPVAASLHVSLQIFGSAPRTRGPDADTGFAGPKPGDPFPTPPRTSLGKDMAMVVLVALIPILMLGAVLALGRYEELMLPEPEGDGLEPAVLPTVAPSPAPAGTPAPSP